MTPIALAFVLIRIGAILLLWQSLEVLPVLSMVIPSEEVRLVQTIPSMAAYAVRLLGAILLWVFAGKLAESCATVNGLAPEPPVVTLDARSVSSVAVGILGLYIAARALPDLLLWLIAGVTEDIASSSNPQEILLRGFFNTGLGAFLFLSCGLWGRVLTGVRDLGMPKPEDDTSR